MDTTLKNHHKAAALLICFIIHSILIVTIMIVDMHTNGDREPIILVADMEQQPDAQEMTSMQAMPQEEWVAMSSAFQNSSFNAMPTPPAVQENSADPQVAQEEVPPYADQESQEMAQEEPTQANETALEKSLDEVLELATQFIQEREPEALKESEPTPAQKIESKLEKFTQKQKQITLAQIAQGFVSHMQQAPSAGSGMDVASDKQGQASMNQLQQLHYCQKIIGCIVNSYKINRFNAPGTQQENRLCVHLALKQDGSIHTLRIVQSSGNSMLDQFVLATFKDASSSFPPLPNTFKQIPYHLPFFNIDRIESLQTTQGWYIDSRHS